MNKIIIGILISLMSFSVASETIKYKENRFKIVNKNLDINSYVNKNLNLLINNEELVDLPLKIRTQYEGGLMKLLDEEKKALKKTGSNKAVTHLEYATLNLNVITIHRVLIISFEKNKQYMIHEINDNSISLSLSEFKKTKVIGKSKGESKYIYERKKDLNPGASQ